MFTTKLSIKDSLSFGLQAGAIAIVINILLLQMGAALGLQTGHGGLLKWSVMQLHLGPIQWHKAPLASLPMAAWKIGFHFVVGIGMALFYTLILEPLLRNRFTPMQSGLLYALLVWLANAFVILPGLSMGIAGSAVIPVSGMLYFAFAHTAFFVILAMVYARLIRSQIRSE